MSIRFPVLLSLVCAAAACGDRGHGGAPPDSVSGAPSATAGAPTREAAPAQPTAPADSARATGGDDRPVVLFVGNSLAAGLGVPEDSAFPAVVQQKIDSAGLRFRVSNAGVSGATSADGLQQSGWLLRQPVDVLVLELGGNDALRGLSTTALEANLRGIIRRFRAVHPGLPVVLAGMEAPPNLGATYTTAFREVYPRVAREENATLIPFLLQGVGGVRRLNQADGIHPTSEGHRMVAANVWRTLEPVLRRADRGTRRKAG